MSRQDADDWMTCVLYFKVDVHLIYCNHLYPDDIITELQQSPDDD